MLPMWKEYFNNGNKQALAVKVVTVPSGKYDITIVSFRILPEDQLDTIVSVISSDVASRYKPEQIAIDIALYTGHCDVNVVKSPKSIKVLIGSN